MTSELSINQYLPTIIDNIKNNAIIQIISPTGTGKSLGIPNKLYHEGYRVFISVPTRTAAYNLYKKQKEIIGPSSDGIVGYAAENNIMYDENTMIVYMTSGHLRRKMFKMIKTFNGTGAVETSKGAYGKVLEKVKNDFCDILMVDEIHSGALDNTILLSLWNHLIPFKKSIGFKVPRLVVASASDVYLPFEKIITLEIDSDSYDVKIFYEKSTYKNSIQNLVSDVVNKIKFVTTDAAGDGHILVFLPTKKDIISVHEHLDFLDNNKFIILEAYGGLEDLQNIYKEYPVARATGSSTGKPGASMKRKVILATNIAETSITIKDVSIVIDSMYENLAGTSSGGGLKLTKTLISQDSAKQRAGRTGRTRAGVCYRLISLESFKKLDVSRKLEINRIPFYEILIEIVDSGIDANDFIIDETPQKERKIKYIDVKDKLNDLIKYDLIITSGKPDTGKPKYEVTEKGRFAAPLTLGIKNSLFLWHWKEKYTIDKLFPGLVIASIIDNYFPPYFFPKVNKNEKETEEQHLKRENKINERRKELFKGANDNLYSNLKMFNTVFSTVGLTTGPVGNTTGNVKLMFDDYKLKSICKDYNLNYNRVIELIKIINNNIKLLKIKIIGSFSSTLDKVYQSAIEILSIPYKDFILKNKSKNNYWDANKNNYVLRQSDVADDFTYPEKIISLSSIEIGNIRNINLFATISSQGDVSQKSGKPGIQLPKKIKKEITFDTIMNRKIFNYEYKKQDVEYTRYIYVKKMASMTHNYEHLNILERWLMSLAYITPDEIFTLSNLIVENKYYQKMLQEFSDTASSKATDRNNAVNASKASTPLKGSSIVTAPDEMAKKWLQLAIEFATLKDYILCPDPIFKDGNITIGELSKSISNKRLKLFRKKTDDINIVCMILRYESLLPRSQQWSTPTEIYQVFKNYGFEIEGFASPINSRMLELDENAKFCSLFYDTDHYFGSLGPFHKYNFTNEKVTVCLPYVEQIIQDALKHMLKNKNATYYIGAPSWDDADYIKTMKEKSIQTKLLEKNKHYFIQYGAATTDNGGSGSEIFIKANFANYIFMFSNDKKFIATTNNFINDLMKVYQPHIDGDNVIVRYENIKRRFQYSSGNKNNNLHVGHLKTFLSEFQFLTSILKNHDDSAVVLYVGSAPATKIPLLNYYFPNVVFILVDPLEHILNYGDKTHYDNDELEEDQKDKTLYIYSANTGNRFNIKNRNISLIDKNNKIVKTTKEKASTLQPSSKGQNAPNSEKAVQLQQFVKDGYRNFIIEKLLTPELTKIINEFDILKESEKFFFISDLRTGTDTGGDGDTESGEEIQDLDILINSAQQYNMIQELQPQEALIKFRCPFMEDNSVNDFIKNKKKSSDLLLAEENGLDLLLSYKEGKFMYYDGEINLQSFSRPNSSETRLHISNDNLFLTEYDPKEYEEKMFYQNVFLRDYCFYNNEEFFNKEIGIDGCGDCAIMIKIIKDYFNKFYDSSDSSYIQQHITFILDLMNRKILTKEHGHKFKF
jgi:HrpA-like RNA helicase